MKAGLEIVSQPAAARSLALAHFDLLLLECSRPRLRKVEERPFRGAKAIPYPLPS